MKKLLLTTTALITLVATGAQAAPKSHAKKDLKVEHKAMVEHDHDHMHKHSAFKVDLHGRYETLMAVRNVKKEYLAGTNNGYLTPNQKNFGFDSNAKVNLEVSSVAENGLKYGANLSVTPDSRELNRNFSSMDKTFLFMEGGFGRLEAGSNYSVSTLMEIGAHSVAAATGGASDGYGRNYLNLVSPKDGTDATSSYTTQGRNFLYRGLVGDGTNNESARKVSFMSPRFSGLLLGISYTPDADNSGSTDPKTATGDTTTKLKNVFSVALNYDYKMSGMDITSTLMYNSGKSSDTTKNKLSEWGIGAKVSKGPLSVAASYDDAKKSSSLKTAKKPKNSFWTLGAGYEMGKLTTSLTYMSAKLGDSGVNPSNSSKTTAWSVGVDYMLASGLKTYAEFTQFTLKNKTVQNTTPKAPSNKATAFMAGAVVKF